jgi:hypothetical protein
MYRSPTGLKCVVGIFISDEDYVPDMEGKVDSLFSFECPSITAIEPHRGLLLSLQRVHDLCENWVGKNFQGEMELANVAKYYHLKYTPPTS